MVHLFPFREEGNPPVLRPTLDVRAGFAGAGEWTFRALVDTGSPTCFVDHAVGSALNVRFGNSGAETRVLRVLGAHLTAQVELVSLTLPEAPEFSWEARVAVIMDPAFRMSFQGVLGGEGFLDRHAVTFNQYENYFAVETPCAAPRRPAASQDY